ncbi:hypothetical protein L21SP2_3442 [Salinispira pacifica]|uniref:Uncharacterized protein n=1 Tax=Salinispira pacifica TaxID=1307761 RepID=V5WMA2_9SPIO|nr:hypothetical protein L21SP2_3442 [Salinispira pacifica]
MSTSGRFVLYADYPLSIVFSDPASSFPLRGMKKCPRRG